MSSNNTIKTDMENSDSAARRPLLNKFVLYKRRWLVLAVFSLVSMTNEVIWISLSSITSIVKTYYGVSSLAVNWLSIIFMLLFLFVIVPSYMLDRYGLKCTIIVGATLNGLGSCLRCIGANRDGFVLVFLGNTSAALAQSFLMFIPPRLAAVWFGENERATASAIGVLMNLSGISVGFLMGIIVPNSQDMDFTVKHGIVTVLVTQAVICSTLMVIAVIFVENAPPTPPSKSQALILQLRDQQKMKDIFEGKVAWNRYGDESMEYANNDDVGQLDWSVSGKKDTAKILPADDNSIYKRIPGFRESLLILAKDKSFHYLVQAFSIYFGLVGAYNTVLNEIVISKYPGKEKEVGYLGCVANLFGVLAMFFSGVLLDRVKIYKRLSIWLFSLSAATILIFTLLLSYHDSFILLSVSFCFFGFFSFPFISVGLEYAAEFMYPISEGTTSCAVLLVGNIYAVILTNIIGAIIRNGGPVMAGYIMAALYVIGLFFIAINNPPLERSEVEK